MSKYFTIVVLFFYILSCGQNPILNVKDFGAKGDGITDDYNALQKAIKELNRQKSGTLYFPKGVYFIKSFLSTSTSAQNFFFENLQNIEIKGDNAEIRLNAEFVRKADWSKRNYNYSEKSHLSFVFRNVRNLKISGLKIDGGAHATKREGTITESKGRILEFRDCKNVFLESLHIHHALTDAVYITGQSENFKGNNLLLENNARQGMSIIQLVSGLFTNSTFARSGQTGRYGGHSPMTGVDIEPTYSNPGVRNVVFDNCIFEDNLGSQLVVSAPDKTENITVKNSTINAMSSKSTYGVILSGSNIILEDNVIDVGEGNIYPVWGKFRGSRVIIRRNKIKSSSRGIISSDKSKTNEVVITDNTIEYTGSKKLTSYFPYIQTAEEFSGNSIIIPEDKVKIKGVSSLLQNVKKVNSNVFVDENKNPAEISVSYKGSVKE